MHQPTKRGAVLKPDIPSDGKLIQVRSAPMWDDQEQVYKMLYRPYPKNSPHRYSAALALSKDGIHWEKPRLGEVELDGSKDNNHIDIASLGRSKLWNVVIAPDAPDPSQRYKGFLENPFLPVVSPDCIHWRKLDVPAMPGGDESILTYDRQHRRFLAMLKFHGRYGRAFNISMSQDFRNWSKPRFLFGTDAEDQKQAVDVIRRRLTNPFYSKPTWIDPHRATGWKPPADYQSRPGYHQSWNAQSYNIAVFPYEGLYVGLPAIYYPTGNAPGERNTDGFYQIQLAMTRDLKQWRRLGDRKPFIGTSRIDKGIIGVFDRMQLLPTNQPVDRGEELWFYYSGHKWRVSPYGLNLDDGSKRDPSTLTPPEKADLEEGSGAVCLAVLRKDGFISLDADGEGGHMLTKPVELTGSTMFLNLDAGSNGSARVEVLDESGNPIDGFSRLDGMAVTGNSVRLPVRWKVQSSLSELIGRTVRLKIYLRDASLYAFWTE